VDIIRFVVLSSKYCKVSMFISMELDNLTSGVVVVDGWTYNASGDNIHMNSDRSLPHLHP